MLPELTLLVNVGIMTCAGHLLLRLLVVATTVPTCHADRLAEDCEACGVVVWRMQTIVARKQAALEDVKRAKEKRAKRATKAHSKRWLRQEYAAELNAALEEQLEGLSKDTRIIGGTCNVPGQEAVTGSELRTGGRYDVGGHVDPQRCAERVASRIEELLGESQDDLTEAVLEGAGAGAACERLVPGCTAQRAQLLLGPQYDEDGADWRALDKLQIGYAADRWTHHIDTDGSSYWYNKARMHAQREPPEGWAQRVDGTWDGAESKGTEPSKRTEQQAAAAPVHHEPLEKAAKVETGEHWVDRAMRDWDPLKVREETGRRRRDSQAQAALNGLNQYAPRHGDKDEI